MRTVGRGRFLRAVLPLLVVVIVVWALGVNAAEDGTVQQNVQDDTTTTEPTAPSGVVEDEAANEQTADALNYDVKVKELEEKVNDLKEKIFRTKTRLLLLEEEMLGGVIGGSKLVIRHINEMGGWFKLESVAYYLDGEIIYRKSDVNGDLDSKKVIEIYNNPITTSTHLVSVYMVYRGNSGLFSYIEGIQVKLKSSHTFVTKEGKTCYVDVVGYDRGGAFVQLKDRPAITYRVRYEDLSAEESEAIQAQQEAEEAAGGGPKQ